MIQKMTSRMSHIWKATGDAGLSEEEIEIAPQVTLKTFNKAEPRYSDPSHANAITVRTIRFFTLCRL